MWLFRSSIKNDRCSLTVPSHTYKYIPKGNSQREIKYLWNINDQILYFHVRKFTKVNLITIHFKLRLILSTGLTFNAAIPSCTVYEANRTVHTLN